MEDLSRLSVSHAEGTESGSRSLLIDLSPEILLLIFEQLYKNSFGSIASLRLLSHSLNAIVTPISYRKITINLRLFDSQSDRGAAAALTNIKNYTRWIVLHVTSPGEYEPEGMAELLSNCIRLADLTWQGWRYNPSSQLRRLIVERPQLRLHLPRYNREADVQCGLAAPLPLPNIVSLQAVRSWPAAVFDNDTFFKSCTNLETLECDALFEFPDCLSTAEMFPKLRELALVPVKLSRPHPRVRESCPDVSSKWDISRLQSLNISLECLQKLLNMKNCEDFAYLRRLKAVEEMHYNGPKVERQSLTNSIRALLNVMHRLEELEITCTKEAIHIPSIIQNKSLRVLKLYEFYFPEARTRQDSDNQYQLLARLSREELEQIQRNCPLITDLDISIDRQDCMNLHFLGMINQFRNLNSLTLRTRPIWSDWGGNGNLHGFHTKIMSHLNSLSRTTPFQEVKMKYL